MDRNLDKTLVSIYLVILGMIVGKKIVLVFRIIVISAELVLLKVGCIEILDYHIKIDFGNFKKVENEILVNIL